MPRDVYASSESKEWYTPARIAELARELMGAIDLDPASSDEAQQTIGASRHYTAADNGLAQPWYGRVYLNPPYGDMVRAFTARLVASYDAGDVSEAIALLPARPDTQWFQPLYRFPICFWRGRVRFNRAGGQPAGSAPFPTVIVYLGSQIERFASLFGDYGQIQRPAQALAVVEPAPLAPSLDRAASYAEHSRSDNTKRAYAADWKDFTSWCDAAGAAPLPALPATVAAYAAHLADSGYAVATIGRRLASISQAHQLAGYEQSPCRSEVVRTVVKGIRRSKGTAQRQAQPATVPVLRRLVDTCGNDLMGIRDRALLLLGFAGALRRSELVALDLADLDFTIEGLVLTIRRSKTDQEGAGRQIGIPYGADVSTCPVRSVRAWCEAAGLVSGVLWPHLDRWAHIGDKPITDRAVALIVKRRAALAGLDPAIFSGHSLRAGLATAAAEAGASALDIQAQTGHKSSDMVARYVRRGSLFRGNVSGKVGL
jgi:integrase